MLPLISWALAAPAVAPMTEIPVYQRLTESDLTLVDVPDALSSDGLVRELADAVGRIALEPLLPGEPLRTERLGTDARATLLGPYDDLLMVPLTRPEAWAPGRLDLVARTGPGKACLLAQDLRSHGSPEPGVLALAVPAVQAHRLQWAMTQLPVTPVARNPIDRSRHDERACSGGLPVSDVALQAGKGSLLRLGEPVRAWRISHDDRVAIEAVTETDLWMHGLQKGHTAGSLQLEAGGPPVVLAIEVKGGPSTEGVAEPVGGLLVLPARSVADARVFPPDAADIEVTDGLAFVRPRQAGPFQAFSRTSDGALELHDLTAIDGWPAPARGEAVLALKPGKARKVSMPATVTAVWAGSDAIATVEVKGRKARVRGGSPGTTRVVVQDATGATSTVRVVVL